MKKVVLALLMASMPITTSTMFRPVSLATNHHQSTTRNSESSPSSVRRTRTTSKRSASTSSSLAAAALLPSKAKSFVTSTASSCRRLERSRNRYNTLQGRKRSRSMSMYFDDVSRWYTVGWKPPSESMSSSLTDQSATSKETTSTSSLGFNTSYGDEKKSAMERMLLGYNAETASELSKREVQDQMVLWAKKSGAVGNFFGDELYSGLVGDVGICDAATMIGCMAQYWTQISNAIDKHTDKTAPFAGAGSGGAAASIGGRWVQPLPVSETQKDQDDDDVADDDEDDELGRYFKLHNNNNAPSSSGPVQLVAFPNCPDLYQYNNMFTFLASMEFAKDCCLYMGSKFQLTMFHPKYKNSPKLFSPERHSPFPSSGIHYMTNHEQKMQHLQYTKRQRQWREKPKSKFGNSNGANSNKKPFVSPSRRRGADDDDYDDDNDAEFGDLRTVRNIKQQRDILEVLYNSAAASPSSSKRDVDENGEIARAAYSPLQGGIDNVFGGDEKEGVMAFSSKFEEEHQRRRRTFSNDVVKDMVTEWIDKTKFHHRSAATTQGDADGVLAHGKTRRRNRALRYIDTVLGSTAAAAVTKDVDGQRDDVTDYGSAGWMISEHIVAEKVYADVWKAIHEVHQIGTNVDKEVAETNVKRKSKDGMPSSSQSGRRGAPQDDSNMETVIPRAFVRNTRKRLAPSPQLQKQLEKNFDEAAVSRNRPASAIPDSGSDTSSQPQSLQQTPVRPFYATIEEDDDQKEPSSSPPPSPTKSEVVVKSEVTGEPSDQGRRGGRDIDVDHDHSDIDEKPTNVISSLVIAKRFCAFNAQSFKRFAITVNAALKRMSGGKMFLEVFHPEYVGDKRYNNSLRRAPFPMIQICYELDGEKE